MSDLSGPLLADADRVAYLANVLLAVTAGAGLSLVAHRLLRHHPAPLRHGVLSAGVAVALLSPLLPLLTAQVSDGRPLPLHALVAGPLPPVAVAIPADVPAPDGGTVAAPAATGTTRQAAALTSAWRRHGAVLMLGAWALGFVVCLLRLGAGSLAVRRLRSSLREVASPRLERRRARAAAGGAAAAAPGGTVGAGAGPAVARPAAAAGGIARRARRRGRGGRAGRDPDDVLRYNPPPMALAEALLAAVERDAVVAYLDACAPLWPQGEDELAQWRAAIVAGGAPAFGDAAIW